jgi:hypothetical protein
MAESDVSFKIGADAAEVLKALDQIEARIKQLSNITAKVNVVTSGQEKLAQNVQKEAKAASAGVSEELEESIKSGSKKGAKKTENIFSQTSKSINKMWSLGFMTTWGMPASLRAGIMGSVRAAEIGFKAAGDVFGQSIEAGGKKAVGVTAEMAGEIGIGAGGTAAATGGGEAAIAGTGGAGAALGGIGALGTVVAGAIGATGLTATVIASVVTLGAILVVLGVIAVAAVAAGVALGTLVVLFTVLIQIVSTAMSIGFKGIMKVIEAIGKILGVMLFTIMAPLVMALLPFLKLMMLILLPFRLAFANFVKNMMAQKGGGPMSIGDALQAMIGGTIAGLMAMAIPFIQLGFNELMNAARPVIMLLGTLIIDTLTAAGLITKEKGDEMKNNLATTFDSIQTKGNETLGSIFKTLTGVDLAPFTTGVASLLDIITGANTKVAGIPPIFQETFDTIKSFVIDFVVSIYGNFLNTITSLRKVWDVLIADLQWAATTVQIIFNKVQQALVSLMIVFANFFDSQVKSIGILVQVANAFIKFHNVLVDINNRIISFLPEWARAGATKASSLPTVEMKEISIPTEFGKDFITNLEAQFKYLGGEESQLSTSLGNHQTALDEASAREVASRAANDVALNDLRNTLTTMSVGIGAGGVVGTAPTPAPPGGIGAAIGGAVGYSAGAAAAGIIDPLAALTEEQRAAYARFDQAVADFDTVNKKFTEYNRPGLTPRTIMEGQTGWGETPAGQEILEEYYAMYPELMGVLDKTGPTLDMFGLKAISSGLELSKFANTTVKLDEKTGKYTVTLSNGEVKVGQGILFVAECVRKAEQLVAMARAQSGDGGGGGTPTPQTPDVSFYDQHGQGWGIVGYGPTKADGTPGGPIYGKLQAGGLVGQTGNYMLHSGEYVVPRVSVPSLFGTGTEKGGASSSPNININFSGSFPSDLQNKIKEFMEDYMRDQITRRFA